MDIICVLLNKIFATLFSNAAKKICVITLHYIIKKKRNQTNISEIKTADVIIIYIFT